MKFRIESGLVDRAIEEQIQAVKDGDFEKFGRSVCRDSNSLHACCLDTTPPIFY